ncbi:MAG: hypothetical protein CHACPFDD_02818 [Phycisphaerae bacterium]|nr:hypothetical protein [Phycisphaerae bacterium]
MRIRRSWLAAYGMVLVAAMAFGLPASAQDKAASGAKCPISGEPIDKSVSVKHKGKDVYFCCPKCKGAFEKEPGKYADAVKAQWEALRPLAVQVTCPVTGKTINKKISVDSPHGPLCFADEDAKAKYQKEPKAFESRLADCYSYQTQCAVMAEDEIDPTVYVEHEGRKVYFCCRNCIKKFNAEPAKYVAAVDAQVKANKAAMEKAHAKP